MHKVSCTRFFPGLAPKLRLTDHFVGANAHRVFFLQPKNHEPKKKRAPKTGESDEESESEDEEYEPSFRPTTDSPTLRTGANADEANEEEWNEQSVKTAEEASGGEEVPGDERRKSNEARRRGAGKKANGDGSSKKKRAPRWTKEVKEYTSGRALHAEYVYFLPMISPMRPGLFLSCSTRNVEISRRSSYKASEFGFISQSLFTGLISAVSQLGVCWHKARLEFIL